MGCDVTELWKLHLISVICFLPRDMLSPPLCFLFPLNSFPLCEERRYSDTSRKIHADSFKKDLTLTLKFPLSSLNFYHSC